MPQQSLRIHGSGSSSSPWKVWFSESLTASSQANEAAMAIISRSPTSGVNSIDDIQVNLACIRAPSWCNANQPWVVDLAGCRLPCGRYTFASSNIFLTSGLLPDNAFCRLALGLLVSFDRELGKRGLYAVTMEGCSFSSLWFLYRSLVSLVALGIFFFFFFCMVFYQDESDSTENVWRADARRVSPRLKEHFETTSPRKRMAK